MLHPALQLINPHDIYKKWVIERENWPKKIKMQQEMSGNIKSETLVQCKPSYGEIADNGIVDKTIT